MNGAPGPNGLPDRIRLVVLFGGRSAEHDISCITAAHVLQAVDPVRYEVTAIGITRDGAWVSADGTVDQLAAGATAIPGAAPADQPEADAQPGPGAQPEADAQPGPAAQQGPASRPGPAASPAPLVAAGAPIDPLPALRADGQILVVVFPLLHGPMGEDGTVQGLLELAGIPYVGSGVLGSAVCMDKITAKRVCESADIPQANWSGLHRDDISEYTAAALAADLGLPVFVKPANMGSSIGVTKARDTDEILAALHAAARYDEWLVVEESIEGCREIEVAVLGNLDPRVSVPGEIRPAADFYDYEDKYFDGSAELLIPALLDEATAAALGDLALRAFRVLRAEGLARVDFLVEEGGRGPLLNEVNTIPGFTPISMYPKMWEASGVPYSSLIDELVALALERHTRRATFATTPSTRPN